MRAVKLCERGVKDSLGRLELPVRGAEIANEMSYRLSQRAAPAPYAACDPLQKGLLSDLPHLHKVTRFRIS